MAAVTAVAAVAAVMAVRIARNRKLVPNAKAGRDQKIEAKYIWLQ